MMAWPGTGPVPNSTRCENIPNGYNGGQLVDLVLVPKAAYQPSVHNGFGHPYDPFSEAYGLPPSRAAQSASATLGQGPPQMYKKFDDLARELSESDDNRDSGQGGAGACCRPNCPECQGRARTRWESQGREYSDEEEGSGGDDGSESRASGFSAAAFAASHGHNDAVAKLLAAVQEQGFLPGGPGGMAEVLTAAGIPELKFPAPAGTGGTAAKGGSSRARGGASSSFSFSNAVRPSHAAAAAAAPAATGSVQQTGASTSKAPRNHGDPARSVP